MTVAELHPIQLMCMIIFGCTVGVYAPMIYWRFGQDMWADWPIQTKIYYGCVGVVFCFLILFFVRSAIY